MSDTDARTDAYLRTLLLLLIAATFFEGYDGAILSLVLEVGVGLAIALTLHVNFVGRGFVRTVMLVPLGVPTIVSGAVMLLIFARAGYMNSILGLFTSVIDKIPGVNLKWANVSWTVAGGWRTLFTVAIADMWKVLPIMTLIFLAGVLLAVGNAVVARRRR